MLRVTVILYEDNLSKEQVKDYLKEKFNYKERVETRVFFHVHDNVLYIVASRDNPDINQGLRDLISVSEVISEDIEVMRIELFEGKIIERKKSTLERYRSIVNSGCHL